MSNSLQTHGLWNSPGQNTGVGSLSLLQGVFPTQESNPGLPHCRYTLYQLSHREAPCMYVCVYIYVCVYVCVCLYLCVCLCVSIFVCICVCVFLPALCFLNLPCSHLSSLLKCSPLRCLTLSTVYRSPSAALTPPWFSHIP